MSGEPLSTRIRALLDTDEFASERASPAFDRAMSCPDLCATADRIFGSDLAGKSVLDVNCGHGYLCLEAAQRGASSVVGLDPDRDAIRLARKLAARLGLDIAFEIRDFVRQPCREPFDHVLCLDILENLRDPILALDRVIALAREQIAVDMAILERKLRKKLRLLPGFADLLARSPLLYVTTNGTASSRQLPKFVITPGALHNLLAHHRRFFSRIDMDLAPDTGRHLTIARKYRIDHLITVAGPVSSGKSTLCRKLLAGEAPEIYSGLGVAPADRPTQVFLPRARGSAPPDQRKAVLFHYNFLNAYVSSAKIHARDENLDLLGTARKLSFLTVWAGPERLVRQITASEIEGGWFHRPAQRHLMLREEYRDAAKVVAHYEAWIEFVESLKARHFIVDQEGGALRLMSVAQWRKLVAPYRRTAA